MLLLSAAALIVTALQTVPLVDVTGVPVFDTFVAKGIIRMGQALRLLGTQMALTGLKPATAQTLAQIGADLGRIKTYAAIQDALLEYQR